MQRSRLVPAAAMLAIQLSLPVQAEEDHAHGDGAEAGMPRLSLVLDAQYARDNPGGDGHEIIEEAAGILHGVHFHEDDMARKTAWACRRRSWPWRPGCRRNWPPGCHWS